MSPAKYPSRRLGANGPIVSAIGLGVLGEYLVVGTETKVPDEVQEWDYGMANPTKMNASRPSHTPRTVVSLSGTPQMSMEPVSPLSDLWSSN